MIFRIQYENRGSVVTRHIIEFNGSEAELIAHMDAAVGLLAQDPKFTTEGGSNADLRAAVQP